MQIYVTRNNQKLGPYTADEVRLRLAGGELSEADPAWHEGLANWAPLPQVLASFPAGPGDLPVVPVQVQRSGLASASFIISMAGIGAWLVIFAAATVGVRQGQRSNSPFMMLVGLFFIAAIAGNVVGTILGIIALTKPLSNKWMAVNGLIVNLVEVLGVLTLAMIGLAMKSH